MKCNFCQIVLESTIDKNKKKLLDKIKELENEKTTINKSLRCSKCKNIFCCSKCMNSMKSHYDNCTGQQTPPNYFYAGDIDIPKYSYVHIPKQLGGGIANMKHIINYTNVNAKLVIFHDCKYMLYELNDGCYWLKYDKKVDITCEKQSKGEKTCLNIIKEIYPNNNFEKIRPKWLINKKTNKPLELDIYCDELKLAIEYNGEQHYKFIPYFHKDESNFEFQCERDILKNNLCKEQNVKLITVPYTCNTYESIKEYIEKNI
jgi:hypothetical protein